MLNKLSNFICFFSLLILDELLMIFSFLFVQYHPHQLAPRFLVRCNLILHKNSGPANKRVDTSFWAKGSFDKEALEKRGSGSFFFLNSQINPRGQV